jgi:LPPG:FO 2-phospho-L-lactate transferase
VGPAELAVIANTGDDVEVYGVHVSPDPDLVTYWLADAIDERGYGIRGDTWGVMDALERAGHAAWFRLGDRDLAMCLLRTEQLRAGARLTDAHAEVVRAMGVEARVIPMSDRPVRTVVRSAGRELPFQEFMILARGEAPIDAVELRGVEQAPPSPDALEALARADAILIGPSNPVISIGPILALPGMREALAEAAAPVVAVSPFVGGRALKGPTEAFTAHAGIGSGADAVTAAYGTVLDGVVADEHVSGVAQLRTDTLMDTPERRRAVAERTLEFAKALSPAS